MNPESGRNIPSVSSVRACLKKLATHFGIEHPEGFHVDSGEHANGEDSLLNLLQHFSEPSGIRVAKATTELTEATAACLEGFPSFVPLTTSDESGTLVLLLDSPRRNRFRIFDGESESVVTFKWLRKNAVTDSHSKIEWFLTSRIRAEEPVKSHTGPISRLIGFIRPEMKDVKIVIVFSIVAGILSLATPLAVEAIVNTIAWGRYIQPLLILSIIVFVFLLFRSGLQTLMAIVVEIIQRRLFARTVVDLAHRIPKVRASWYMKNHGPEMLNRFFDIVNVQKVTAKLLLDTLAVILQTIIGLAVLAFYHPFLLGYDVGLIALMVFILWFLGRGAIRTAVRESKTKYKTAAWLQEMSRHQETFGINGGAQFAVGRADDLALKYLEERKSHFRIAVRQYAFILLMQAVAATTLLALGGYLVIINQMTLGQLVAAELIVTVILGSFAKLGKDLESFYDLVASMDKLGQLFDMPTESQKEQNRIHSNRLSPTAAKIEFKDLKAPHVCGGPHNVLLPPGENLAIYGSSGSGKSQLINCFNGKNPTQSGVLKINDHRWDWYYKGERDERFSFLSDIEIFAGTIEENIRLGRTDVHDFQLETVLAKLQINNFLLRYPDGLRTELSVGGSPLSESEKIKIMLARVLVESPSALFIDGLLDRLGDSELEEMLASLGEFDEVTMVMATGRKRIADWASKKLDLHEAG